MRSSIEDFKTGWYGVSIALDNSDIEKLIGYLNELKDDKTYHFHVYTTASDIENGGIADIQFVRKLENESSNMDTGA